LRLHPLCEQLPRHACGSRQVPSAITAVGQPGFEVHRRRRRGPRPALTTRAVMVIRRRTRPGRRTGAISHVDITVCSFMATARSQN
jgi:hypothetical protein